MNTECSAFVRIHLLGDIATRPLVRPTAVSRFNEQLGRHISLAVLEIEAR
ncbi:hypothetical protein [Sulfuriferula plumbiphila]|nr:hypothetical protein [Sulfuriferula plumbiphila]